MIIGKVDIDVIQKVLSALSDGSLLRVEAETPDGKRRVIAYYLTDDHIHIDIKEDE